MKYIKRTSAVKKAETAEGNIINSTNINDKTINTYSAEIIDSIAGDIYTLSKKQLVGKWIDGKNMYRLVVQTTMPSNATVAGTATTRNINIRQSSPYSKYIFVESAFMIDSSGSGDLVLPIPYRSGDLYTSITRLDRMNSSSITLTLETNTGTYSDFPVYISLICIAQ